MKRLLRWMMLGLALGGMLLAVVPVATAQGPLTLKVANPTGQVAGQQTFKTAPRVAELNGKTIGLLCDWNLGHDEMFTALKKALSARFKDVKFVEWRSEAITPLTFKEGIDQIVGPAKKTDAVIGFWAL